jgi:hypothetical protein
VSPRVGLDGVEKRKFLTLTELEFRTLRRPARSQSVYRLQISCAIVTVWAVGVRFTVGQVFFFFSYRPDQLWGPSSLLSIGHESIEVRGREAGHSPPASP